MRDGEDIKCIDRTTGGEKRGWGEATWPQEQNNMCVVYSQPHSILSLDLHVP